MEEVDQTSEQVVITDMAEPLANKTESDENRSSENHGSVSVTAVDGVPVSSAVPVASLINVSASGSFNVITPEQLQITSGGSLRPILCVENSCICDNHNDKDSEQTQRTTQWFRSENGQLKATHIVIENTDDSPLPNNATWLASASQPIIPVRCKNTSAELHKARFGSGGRGRCIKYGNSWYTPSEFEALCGRASSKDWKRSIRFGGRSLQSLIDGGILTPHATSCTCAACCDDERAMGPVRLFTPYKRKKRKETDDMGMRKVKRESRDNLGETTNGEESCDSSEQNDHLSLDPSQEVSTSTANPPSVVSVSAVNNNNNPQQTEEQPQFSQASMPDILSRLDKTVSKLMKMVFQLRKDVDEAKAQWKSERDLLQFEHKRDREQAILAARVETQVACSRAVFDSTVHVVDPITTVGLQPTDDNNDNKKCANCNREAFAECSLCRRTPYCSTFCQRKDWTSHQVECVRSATNEQGSIMLIVESATEQVLGVQE